MIISVEEYNSFIAEKEQFKKDKKEHEDKNLVLTTYQGLMFRCTNWVTHDEAIKKAIANREREIKDMSIKSFKEWRKK